MTILHVVLGKMDSSYSKESKEDVYKELRLSLDAIPVPKRNVHVGAPLNPSKTRGYDIMLAMTFDKLEDFQAYVVHPKHIAMLKREGPPLFKGMVSYQVDGGASKSKL